VARPTAVGAVTVGIIWRCESERRGPSPTSTFAWQTVRGRARALLGKAAVASDATQVDRLVLHGQPSSVGAARRFVRQRLESARRPEWVEAASLAVSELVTNSVLHAHSDVDLRVQVKDDHVRIEVWDRSPGLPMPRSYDETATTGRGLELVATVSFDHGVETFGADGKVVWCCVNSQFAEAGYEADFHPDEWADLLDPAVAPRGDADSADTVVVTLLGLPPTLWLAAREHHDALLREMALVQASMSGDPARALAEDLRTADNARTRISEAVLAAIEVARRIGTAMLPLPEHHPGDLPAVPAAVDLDVHVRRSEAELFARLQDVLDQGERLARAGELLVRPGLPEIVAVRDWACEQIIAQSAGSPPIQWIGVDDDRFAAVDPTVSTTGWVDTNVSQADIGVIAVDDANRVVAVSQRLLGVLGWKAAELVGRRVVTIVPPRFREAHVAGFSRHLSTGVARALDVPLRLPVLRADGTEVECTFRIHAERAPTGRTVYVAQIEPI
jgi:PAS domain S-box-containing protein